MPSFAMGKELAGLGGLFNRFVAAPITGAALFNQGRSGSLLDQGLRSIPSTRNTDAGRAAGNELMYMGGQLMRGKLPYSQPAVGRIPPSANGESYRRAELRLGDAARAGGGGGGGGNAGYSLAPSPMPSLSGGAPAERAYQRAKTQTAAQVAADPLLQKWEAARQAKDYATADQLGQQIWQNKYGATPMGQPGGAVGSFNPLMQSTFGYQAGMSPREISQTITNPSPAPVAPGEAPLQMGDLGTGAMDLYGYDATRYGITPERIEEIKAKLLQQAKK